MYLRPFRTNFSHSYYLEINYRELSDLKIPWDEEIPDILQSKFKKWVQDISSNKITTGYSA